jgi:tetratricopeptide (TPR) repeat protein
MRKRRWLKYLSGSIVSLVVVLIVLTIIYSQLFFRVLLGFGSLDTYYGNNERGNKIMNYAISRIEDKEEEIYHHLSIQNTKNGNYNIAIAALEKAFGINPKEVAAYYGWVLLYYYHDYEKALVILDYCDALTPNFSDAPMAEDIHKLKGLAHMQLENYEKAIEEFDLNISEITETIGEEWVDVYTFVNKGRCLSAQNKHRKSIEAYQTALNNYQECTEAYYYMALDQLKIKEEELACKNLNTAYTLIKKGYKSADNYIEYFHEVYEQEIESSILTYCTNTPK